MATTSARLQIDSQALPRLSVAARFPYEYERDRLAIDLINGIPFLREWADDANESPVDLDAITKPDETSWLEERERFLLYSR